MSTDPRQANCELVRHDLPELALGTLSGLERSTVLSHVQDCSDCRDEVDRLSAAADAVLTLAPEMEPSPGFETRLFERMGVSPRRRRRLTRRVSQRVALAGGALLGALGLGLGFGLTTGGGLAAMEPTVIAANLTAGHVVKGEVYLAPGKPGWLFMSVEKVKATGLVTCWVRTAHGPVTVGSFWLQGGSGSWANALPVPAAQITAAWVVGGDGTVLARAQLT